MLRVTIELLPLGEEWRMRHLGTMIISNDGTGTQAAGNYRVTLSKWGKPGTAWRTGRITGFRRLRLGPYDLLLTALLSLLGGRNNARQAPQHAEYFPDTAYDEKELPVE